MADFEFSDSLVGGVESFLHGAGIVTLRFDLGVAERSAVVGCCS